MALAIEELPRAPGLDNGTRLQNCHLSLPKPKRLTAERAPEMFLRRMTMLGSTLLDIRPKILHYY
jgi:hypothetical protein